MECDQLQRGLTSKHSSLKVQANWEGRGAPARVSLLSQMLHLDPTSAVCLLATIPGGIVPE